MDNVLSGSEVKLRCGAGENEPAWTGEMLVQANSRDGATRQVFYYLRKLSPFLKM